MTTAGVAQANGKSAREWNSVLHASASEVFEMMLNARITEWTASIPAPEISAMVGLAGQLCGVLSMRCGRQAAATMASRMLGVDMKEVGPEECDAFGEVCNMVAGNFKNKIPGLGDGCMLSVPTIVMGKDYIVHSLADSSPLGLKLNFEGMPLEIALEVHT